MTNVITIAEKLADEFRMRAADYDRTGEFPVENYRRMREEGYLAGPVPAECGGLGADLATMARAQRALARGCASTALAVNMHLFQVGSTADGFRGGNAAVEPLLKRIAAEGIVIASNGAEAIVAGDWTSSTTAERRNGGYVINGRKFFCSQAPGADVFRFLARDMESGETLVFGAPRSTAGINIVETWDTTGITVTPSGAVVAVISNGDDALLDLSGRDGRHFPQTEDGTYAGHHPADSRDCIAALERLRSRGVSHLVLPATSLWWLRHYEQFEEYLRSSGRLLWREDGTGAVFALRGGAGADKDEDCAEHGVSGNYS